MNLSRYNKHRPLFTDGWNSFWHFFFGLVTIEYIYVLPLFVTYQLIDLNDKNTVIDLAEYFIGFLTAIFVKGFTETARLSKCTKATKIAN